MQCAFGHNDIREIKDPCVSRVPVWERSVKNVGKLEFMSKEQSLSSM